MAVDADSGEARAFSEARSCCGHAFPELSPQSFSFNSPLGMCPACNGLGTRIEVDPELVVPDKSLSIREGAIAPWAAAMERGEGWTFRIIDALAKACDVDLDTPWSKLGRRSSSQVLYGLGDKRIRGRVGQGGQRDPRHLGHALRGRRSAADAPLPADELGGHARALRALHERARVRRLRRQAPARRRAWRCASASKASPSCPR